MSKKAYSDEYKYIRRLYNEVKRNCKKRKRPFNLSLEEYRKIIFKNCTYCGAPPVARKRGENSILKLATNGLDRIDPKKGYFKENCVPCCAHCNYMKFDKSVDEFFQKVREIHEFSAKKN